MPVKINANGETRTCFIVSYLMCILVRTVKIILFLISNDDLIKSNAYNVSYIFI